MKKIKNKGRQGTGKRPTRVPRKMLPPASTTTSTKNVPTHGKSKARPKPPSAHRMTTRARAKNFQFMSLPAELRAMIYEKLFSMRQEPLSLANFQLPRTLYWSRTIRSEAMSVFFAASIFATTFRSNWCVRNAHWHSAEYQRHHETGVLDLSPLLQNGDLALPKKAIRFHNIDFNVRCVCCVQVIDIGSVQLRVDDRKPKVTSKFNSSNLATKSVWPQFMADVDEKLKRVGERDEFNGFTMEDLEQFAMCFRQADVADKDPHH